MNRRGFVRLAGAFALPALAGCGSTGPRPRIEGRSIDGDLSGETRFTVRVRNEGDAGAVRITVTVLDANGGEVASVSRDEYLEAGATREVEIAFEVPDGAAEWSVSATAV